MERRSVALNPRSTLFARGSALQFAIEHRLDTAISLSDRLLREGRWALYDVRRIYRAALDKETKKPIVTKKGTAWRSVETLAEGTHQQMDRELRRRAASKKTTVTTDSFAITRAPVITLAGHTFPATEQFLSIGPAGVCDKRQKNFSGLWSQLVDQTTLFAA